MSKQEKIIEKIIELERQLYQYDGDDKVISSYEMQKLIEADKKRVVEIKTNIPTLDELLGGFESGELTVISGTTGQGKTLFCQSLTATLSRQGIPCLWFSFELTVRSFLRSFGSEVPLFYLPKRLKINSLQWLEQRIWEAKLKYDTRVVFIDHLHFLVDMQTRQNLSLEIGYVMRTLKRIAVEHNICIFLIAHTVKVKSEKEIDLEELRDSAFVGCEADNVLMIWRRPKTEREAVLKVCKNRKRGVLGKIPLIKTEEGILAECVKEEIK